MKEKNIDIRRDLEMLKKKAESAFGPRAGGSRGSSPAGAAPPPVGEHGGDSPQGARAVRSGPLEKLVPGGQYDLEGGSFYRILVPAEEIRGEAGRLHDEYMECLSSPFAPRAKCLEHLSVLRSVPAAEACYLDIETTGLDNTPLFLVGLMYIEGARIMIDQLFARDYTEEEPVLRHLSGFLARFRVLVTFNGARFDLPFIADRMTVGGIEFKPPPAHLDLLPVSRGLLGRRTPNHKLQTLEVHVLGRKRVGDIPGREIPRAYHEYVRTSDAGAVAGIINHNRLDLLSMLELVTAFITQDQLS